METVVKIHTTATSVHFLNNEGTPVVKLRVGDAYYVTQDGMMYVCRKKFAKQCGYERHFSVDEQPVCAFNVDLEEFRKVDEHIHLSFVMIGCICHTSEYNWYSDTCSKLCFD